MSESEPASLTGNRLILLIDDDEAVCGVLRTLLGIRGFKVLTALNGSDGVALYREKAQEIAAVITDIKMPGLDGHGVIAELCRFNPDVRIVAISGSLLGSRPAAANLVILPKPVNSEELVTALETVIAA